MIFMTSKTGAWDVVAGQVNTPELLVRGVHSTHAIKITCQFFARTMSDELIDGFEYTIAPADDAPVANLTPNVGLVQGSDSWQSYVQVVLFEVLTTSELTAPMDVAFNLSIAKQGMNGSGAMMNYSMFAELVEIAG